jgi:hypothetical protein
MVQRFLIRSSVGVAVESKHLCGEKEELLNSAARRVRTLTTVAVLADTDLDPEAETEVVIRSAGSDARNVRIESASGKAFLYWLR